MPFSTLIAADELAQHLGDMNWAIVDCRFSLDNTERGRRDYEQAHIPGAIYAHLDEDLCSPIIPGKTGRHPLPDQDTLVETFSNWGIDSAVQVVAYDDAGGMFAARLWWMLRWLGQDTVALLDGGWQAWQQANLPTRSGIETRPRYTFRPRPREHLFISTEEVQQRVNNLDFKLIDARSAERYRGENETIDPQAGHIPGAISAPFADNLGADGRFRSTDELRTRYQSVMGQTPAANTALYCGSGVSAAHSLVAMLHAGLGDGRLYVGSWSEWITDPQRPIEGGQQAATPPG